MPPGKLEKGKHGLTGGIRISFGLQIQWKHQNGHIPLILSENGQCLTFWTNLKKSWRAKRAWGPRENLFFKPPGTISKAKKEISI